jgi:hypothetical protein
VIAVKPVSGDDDEGSAAVPVHLSDIHQKGFTILLFCGPRELVRNLEVEEDVAEVALA